MTRFKSTLVNFLYRWLDKLTAPDVQKIPPVVTRNRQISERREINFKVNGGHPAAWAALQGLRLQSKSKLTRIEVYAAMSDTEFMSCWQLGDRLNVTHDVISPHMSQLFRMGFIERKMSEVHVTGQRAVLIYRRRNKLEKLG